PLERGLSAHVGHQDAHRVAHLLGVDVLVRGGGLGDGGHVQPALVREGRAAREGLVRARLDVQDLVAWLQSLRAEDSTCFVLGHNPALTDLCNLLAGRPALDNLPTAGYLRFSVPVEQWIDLTEGIGVLEHYVFPKDLSS
ncbi:MAG: hypothetical protein AAF194_02980, partial [Pseudomonadota bacterium]